jgi:hypothetical protein
MATLEYDPAIDPAELDRKVAFLTEQCRELHDRLASVEMLSTVMHSLVLDIHGLLFRAVRHARD